eukprot:TRINITY_DN9485_c0_g1_i1.p1 TRINITY_DN9485_c0_g1~~TRINITY_DN9485_c0_g1_i1.p1  ORF type:complete len:2641 (+),score=529.85 TRINITY_DN9485_c0_g1_i1:70-7923(+)
MRGGAALAAAAAACWGARFAAATTTGATTGTGMGVPSTGPSVHQNCTMSGWSPWAACADAGGRTLQCGSGAARLFGTTTRSRVIIALPTGTGLQCDDTHCTVAANPYFVPGGYVACSTTSQEVVCTIDCGAAAGGVADANCTMSGWGLWSDCNATCGTNGTRARARNVLRPGRVTLPNGTVVPAACGDTAETETCAGPVCTPGAPPLNVSCVLSGWGSWGPCNETCPAGANGTTLTGVSIRERRVLIEPQGVGAACGPLNQTQPCTVTCAAVAAPGVSPCVVTGWSPWTPSVCPACGGGNRTRIRNVFSNPHNQPCPDLNETEACGTPPCAVTPPTAAPSVFPCPGYSGWSPWGPCNVTCGPGGFQERTRTIMGTRSHPGYVNCTEPLVDYRGDCNNQSCAGVNRDCVMGNWSLTHTGGQFDPNGWTPCSMPCCAAPGCGGGYQRRYRSIAVPPLGNGSKCNATEETLWGCNSAVCPAVDCAVGPWSAWSDCSVTCIAPPGVAGNGTPLQWHYRNVTAEPQYGGRPCDPLSESRDCAPQPPQCSEDCRYGNWSGPTYSSTMALGPNGAVNNSGWSECTEQCDTGWTIRSMNFFPTPYWSSPTTREWGQGSCDFCQGPSKRVVKNNGTLWISHVAPGGAQSGGSGNYGSLASQPGGLAMWNTHSAHIIANTGYQCWQNESCNTHACLDMNCLVSSWATWSDCSKPCQYRFPCAMDRPSGAYCHGGHQAGANPKDYWFLEPAGQRCRTRYVITPALGAGIPCPVLEECEACNQRECDNDCVLSPWGEWTQCTATCWDPGGGAQPTRSRTRVPVIERTLNGRACGATTDTEICQVPRCNQPCTLSPWSAWSHCSLTCGTGTQTRTRTVVDRPITGGVDGSIDADCDRAHCTTASTQPCTALTQTQTCNELACRPGDCMVSDWDPWGPCRGGNGTLVFCAPPGVTSGGVRVRERSVLSLTHGNGLPCPVLREEQPCAQTPCPSDCVVGSWSPWSACSAACGGGTQERRRTGDIEPQSGGASCPLPREEERPCNEAACTAGDCAVGPWESWSDCSAQCGGGVQSRARVLISPAAPGRPACPPLREWRVCNGQICATDCTVGAWESWSLCSATCGGGQQEQLRHALSLPTAGGAACPAMSQTRDCGQGECIPGTCILSAWTAWTPCSRPCAGGAQRRTRSIVTTPVSPNVCPPLAEERQCNMQPCAADCLVSEWTEWEHCTAYCGDSYQLRRRFVLRSQSGGGLSCPQLLEVRGCTLGPCSAQDCAVGPWGAWQQCSEESGGGLTVRSRVINDTRQPGAIPGAPCPPAQQDTRHCNPQAPPLSCVVSGWSGWTLCSRECGGGQQTRERWIEHAPSGGGAVCPQMLETRECNPLVCSPDACQLTAWTPWSACSANCGPAGVRTRTRSIVQAGRGGAASCPPTTESAPCNRGACDAHCVVSEWGAWSLCSATCGGGWQERLRWIAQQRAGAGDPCPELLQRRPCAEARCARGACIAAGWGPWGACSAPCGGGTQQRTRQLPAVAACAAFPTRDERTCNMQRCDLASTPAPPPAPAAAVSEPRLSSPGVAALCGTATFNANASAVAGRDVPQWLAPGGPPALQAAADAARGRLWLTLDLAAVFGATGAGQYSVCIALGDELACDTLRVADSEYDLRVGFEGGSSAGSSAPCSGGGRECTEAGTPLYLHTTTEWRRCLGGVSVPSEPPPGVGLSFRWGGLTASAARVTAATNSLSLPSLYIPGDALPVGVHLVEVRVCPTDAAAGGVSTEDLCRNASAEVRVARPALVAAVAGGNRSVSPGEALVLDGGASRDPDPGEAGPLTYTWACAPAADCGPRFPTNSSASPILTVDPPLPPGQYAFTLTVSRGARVASSPPVWVTVLGDPGAVGVRVACSCSDPSAVRHDVKLAVWAEATAPYDLGYEWTFTQEAPTVPGAGAAAPQLLPAAVGRSGRHLVIPAGTLGPSSVYTAAVIIRRAGAGAGPSVGTGRLELRTQSVPSGGSCTARGDGATQQGSAMETPFSVSCSGWTCGGSAAPLVYRFGAVSADGAEAPLGLGFRPQPGLSGVLLPEPQGEATVRLKAYVRCGARGPVAEYVSDSVALFVTPQQSAVAGAAAAERLRTAARQGRSAEAARLLRQSWDSPLRGALPADEAARLFADLPAEANTAEEAADLLSTAAALAARAGELGDQLLAALAEQVAALAAAAARGAAGAVPASAAADALQVAALALAAGGAAASGAAAGGAGTEVSARVNRAARDTAAAVLDILAAAAYPGEPAAVVDAGSVSVAASRMEAPLGDSDRVAVAGSAVAFPNGAVPGVAGYDVRVSVWDVHPYAHAPDPRVATRVLSLAVRRAADGAPLTDFAAAPLLLRCVARPGAPALPRGGDPGAVTPAWFNQGDVRWDPSGLRLTGVSQDASLQRQAAEFTADHATDFAVLRAQQEPGLSEKPRSSGSVGSGGDALLWVLVVLGVVLCACFVALAILVWRRRRKDGAADKAASEADPPRSQRSSRLSGPALPPPSIASERGSDAEFLQRSDGAAGAAQPFREAPGRLSGSQGPGPPRGSLPGGGGNPLLDTFPPLRAPPPSGGARRSHRGPGVYLSPQQQQQQQQQREEPADDAPLSFSEAG